jgi:hypothetical protein
MKGRTKCPKCNHAFVMDLPSDKKTSKAVCPNCETEFTIEAKCKIGKSGEECYWEEHGEPRKTILSSIKPKTNKPKIAVILLACVFALGITTAIFSEMFIVSSMDVASTFGMTGNVEIHVIDKDNKSINNITVSIEGVNNLKKTSNGSYSAKKVELGIKEISITSLEYNNLKQEILITPFFTSYHEIRLDEGNEKEIKDFNTSSCSIILIIFSVFALIGAVACIQRKHFDVAVVGSLVGILSFGFFMIGSILCIIAFVIIIKSKEEFDDGKKGKVF